MIKLNRHGVIYKITNKTNGKCYIGQTIQKDPFRRIKQHFNPNGKKTYVRNAIKSYGKDNFTIDLLVTAFDQQTLNELEIKFIKKFNCLFPNGYNLLEGGKQNGKCHPQTKAKLSKLAKERYVGKVHPLKGKKFSKEHLENLSKVRKGFDSLARKKARELNSKKRRKPIVAIDLKTNKEYKFNSITECEKTLKLQGCNISRVCNGATGRTQHKGYTFNYINEKVNKEANLIKNKQKKGRPKFTLKKDKDCYDVRFNHNYKIYYLGLYAPENLEYGYRDYWYKFIEVVGFEPWDSNLNDKLIFKSDKDGKGVRNKYYRKTRFGVNKHICGRYQSRFVYKKKSYWIGLYDSKNEAYMAVKEYFYNLTGLIAWNPKLD